MGTTRNYGCLDADLSFASISSKTVSHGIQVPENHRVDCDLPRKRSRKWSRCGQFPVNFLNPGEKVELFNVDAGSARYSTCFPVSSLPKREICGFWAEFDAFGSKFEKLPVIFPDLRLFEDYPTRIEMAFRLSWHPAPGFAAAGPLAPECLGGRPTFLWFPFGTSSR